MQLENDAVRVRLNPQTGAVTSLVNKTTGSDLIAEPRLAENFRLLLPVPDLDANYIDGLAQQPSRAAATRDDQGYALHWDGPLTNARGAFDLAVTLRVELDGPALRFSCRVRNGTPHELAEVWYAMVGGMRGLGEGEAAKETQVLVAYNNRAGWSQKLFADFGNSRGQTLGVLGAEHSWSYPGY